MILVLALLVALVFLLWRWARASPFAAVLVIPVAWYLIWLAFLPMDPTRLEWFLSLCGAIMVSATPCWIKENSLPRQEILGPWH